MSECGTSALAYWLTGTAFFAERDDERFLTVPFDSGFDDSYATT